MKSSKKDVTESRHQVRVRAIGSAVAAALLMGSALSARADITAFTPSAYAESELLISNFRLLDVGTGLSLGTLVGGSISSLTASVTSTLSASINGVPGVAGPTPSGTIINPLAIPAPTISHSVSAGPNAANYVPYTTYGIGALGAGIFAGAASDHVGNGLQLNGQPATSADTHAQVNINGNYGFGSADSRQTLGATFTLTVVAPLVADVLFDAESYLRIALGQNGILANASRSWGLTVRPTTSLGNLLDWVPNGAAGGLGGACVGLGVCAELADGFDLNFEANTQNTSDLDEIGGPLMGSFGVRLGLTSGTYVITVSHETNADASIVPEPGSLALLGIALLGMVGIRRGFNKLA